MATCLVEEVADHRLGLRQTTLAFLFATQAPCFDGFFILDQCGDSLPGTIPQNLGRNASEAPLALV
ncbi:hypothetical protein [Marinobacter sp. S6332]|uniref:hypothetical protein n=1 Tax=Marinobacter sp. S6332 TaxID=2926403 RepID=UPI001FF5D5EB|nr:hypothetical protein [Marinobacter sp. S6332]MCK0165657.1 hypothetical protein [Marinobacter sp. S6332]